MNHIIRFNFDFSCLDKLFRMGFDALHVNCPEPAAPLALQRNSNFGLSLWRGMLEVKLDFRDKKTKV